MTLTGTRVRPTWVRRAVAGFAAVAAAATLALAGAAPASALPPAPSPSAWTWDLPSWGYQPTGERFKSWDYGYWYTSPRGLFWVSGSTSGPSSGGFAGEHIRTGGGRGQLGYPVANAARDGVGTYQAFERGVIYYERRHFTVKNGGFRDAHTQTGGGTGYLRYPTGNEVQEAPGWWYQQFQEGMIYVSPRGAYPVIGQLAREHTKQGGGRGLGYPLAREVHQSAGYTYQQFERGVVYCATPSSRTYCSTVKGGFSGIHAAHGGGGGSLGYPTGNESYDSWKRTWTQRFENGTVELDPKTGGYWVTWERNRF